MKYDVAKPINVSGLNDLGQTEIENLLLIRLLQFFYAEKKYHTKYCINFKAKV